MSDEEIKEARAVIEAARPGPWKALTLVHNSLGVLDVGGAVVASDVWSRFDREFIAAARVGWPAALDEVERLRTALALIATRGTSSEALYARSTLWVGGQDTGDLVVCGCCGNQRTVAECIPTLTWLCCSCVEAGAEVKVRPPDPRRDEVECPAADPSCEGGDGDCHDACEGDRDLTRDETDAGNDACFEHSLYNASVGEIVDEMESRGYAIHVTFSTPTKG